jgi:predicted small lipoprotein YifL
MALGLAACGRKSALDPPPNAAVPPPVQTSQAGSGQAPEGRAPSGEEAAAPAPNRGFILDPLLR